MDRNNEILWNENQFPNINLESIKLQDISNRMVPWVHLNNNLCTDKFFYSYTNFYIYSFLLLCTKLHFNIHATLIIILDKSNCWLDIISCYRISQLFCGVRIQWSKPCDNSYIESEHNSIFINRISYKIISLLCSVF